jgi:hypothetical protein
MTVQSWLAGLLLSAASVVAVQAQPDSAAPRLAILAIDPELGDADNVLTTAFSKREGVLLLERAQIEKVYHEQQLSTVSQDIVKLGQILGANGVAILHIVTEGTNQFLQTRLVAANPGVVLAEFRSPWPLQDLVQWSGFVADDFSPCFPKLTVLSREAVPLSVLNLRSSLGNAANQELERELTVLLIHRLAHERDIFVLERQHLGEALAEKELAPDELPFWSGRYLLDGIIDKEGFDPMTATISASLTPPQGGVPIPIEVSGLRTNLNILAESLVARILAALHRDSSPAGWNPAREADQFFGEAQWAYRWRMLPEAAAAADAAWALGRRDKAVAELRISACCAQVLNQQITDPSQVTGLAPLNEGMFGLITQPLAPAIRAQELFCQNWRLGCTKAAAPEVTWYNLGLWVIRAGTSALGSYYHQAELRPSHEDQLAQLRTSVRQTVSILETNRPPDRSDLPRSMEWQTWKGMKWQMMGYWFDKPEDALPIFRRLINDGYHTIELPVLTGWSWADRQRLPHLLKQWLGEVSRDTNLPVRLEGQVLSLMRAPDDGSGQREECEKDYLATIWQNRRWVLDSPTNLWPLLQVEEIFLNNLPLRDNEHLRFDSLNTLVRRMEVDYLSNPSSAKEAVFDWLFQSPFHLTPSNAMDLIPLMEKFQPPWMTAKRRVGSIDSLRRVARAGSPAVPNVTAARPVASAEEPFEAGFIGWNLRAMGLGDGWRPRLQDGIFHQDRLLFKIDYIPPPIILSQISAEANWRTSFVSVDPKTGASKEIAFPEYAYSAYDRTFDFSADSLYVGGRDKIYRYRFGPATWEAIPVPIERAVQLVVLSGRVYISTAVNLLELDPDSRNVRIIASSRRRPTENQLDSHWDQRLGVYARADGKLGAVIGGLASADFDPVSSAWENFTDIPAYRSEPSQWLTLLFSPGGALELLSGSPSKPHRLLAFWNNYSTPATLLADTKWEMQCPDTNLTAMAPRWEWPKEFDLDTCFLLGDGKSLWALAPRKLHLGLGQELEKVQFSDNRQATLLHFLPDFRAPFSTPMRFQNSNPAVDPLDYEQSGLQPHFSRGFGTPLNRNMVMLDTPENVVLGVPNVMGLWRFPKSGLEARFSAQSESLRIKARAATSPIHLPAGTNLVPP